MDEEKAGRDSKGVGTAGTFQLFLSVSSLQRTKGVDGGRAVGSGVKLSHVYSQTSGINREPNVHFRELAAQQWDESVFPVHIRPQFKLQPYGAGHICCSPLKTHLIMMRMVGECWGAHIQVRKDRGLHVDCPNVDCNVLQRNKRPPHSGYIHTMFSF